MSIAFPKPTKRTKERKRIRTYRPAGTVRREAKAAGYVDPIAWEAVLHFYRDLSGVIRCAYCLTARATETDHVVPLSKGGEDVVGNRVPCCSTCNQRKGTSVWEPALEHPWLAPVEAA